MSSIASSSQTKTRFLIPPWLSDKWGFLGILFILYILFNLAWTYFHWGGPERVDLIANLLSFAPSLLAAVLAWRVAAQKSLSIQLRRAWFILGMSFLMCLLGDLIWAYLELVLKVEPFPSIADVFYLAFYPLGLWGLLSLPSAPPSGRERLTLWLDLLSVLTGATMYVGYFIIVPTAATSQDILTQLIAAAYPIGSLLMIGGILAVLYRRPSPNIQSALIYLYLLVGMLFFVGGDMAFGYTSLIGTYSPGNWTDASWNVAQLFFGLAALRKIYHGPTASATKSLSALRSRVTAWLPPLVVALGYGLVFYVMIVNGGWAAAWLLAGALLLTLLVIARQIASPAFAGLPVRLKLILTFFMVSVLSIFLVSVTSYFTIRSNLQSALGVSLKPHAADRAQDVGNLLATQSNVLESFALSKGIQNLAITASAAYGTDYLPAIWDQLGQRDLSWSTAADSDPLVQAVLNNEASHELHKFQDYFAGYSDLLLTDKYGAVLAATDRPSTYDQSVRSWWWGAVHRGQGSVSISQPFIDPETQSRYLILVVPVYSDDSDLVGMLTASYSFKDVEKLLVLKDHELMHENSLLLPTDQLITSSDKFVFLPKDTLDSMHAAANEDFALMSFLGKPQLVSQALVTSSNAVNAEAISHLNWTLISYEEGADAFAPLNPVWKSLLLSTLTILALATVLAIVLAQMLAAPISRLTGVAEQIATGDLTAKAQIESYDEIGTLASTFNNMMEALSDAQRELRESEALYRSLVDYSPDMIVVFNERKILFMNPAGVKLLGAKSADELIGQPIFNVIPPQDMESTREGIAQVWATRVATPLLQHKMHRLDGTSFQAEFRAIPISYVGEPVIQFVMRDITERKTAEEQIHQLLAEVEHQKGDLEIRVTERTEELNGLNEQLQSELIERQQLMVSLRESEQRFRLLFEASPDAILLIDPNGSWPIVDCNEVACTMNGYTREELIGQSVDLINNTPGDAAERKEYLDFLRHEGVLHRDGFHRHKNGHIFPIEVSSSLVSFAGRELVLGIDRDITERKQIELALEQAKDVAEASRRLAESASGAKSEFLSRMSHELRTPMNAILGFAQLLEMSHKDPLTSTQHERVRQIVKGGQHLLDLINEILDISRIEANRLQISPEPVSVRESIQEVLDLVTPLAVKRHIQVVTRLGNLDVNPFVMADRQRLKQILLNLLSNAVKYNYEGGSVIVTCLSTADNWRISVSDTGPGILQENLERLFQPFERLVSEQSNIEGTGLGLTLAKRLVEMMHGQIGVESVVGRGSTFWIELPSTESPLERAHLTGGTGMLPVMSATPQTILYVEDNVANFELIQEVLADYSQIELVWAADVKTGFEMARGRRPSLILLDLHLSGSDGAEVLQQLKQDEKMAGIPVIVVSADATSGQIERLTSLGAQAYLTKPLNVKHFVRVIEELLGEKEH